MPTTARVVATALAALALLTSCTPPPLTAPPTAESPAKRVLNVGVGTDLPGFAVLDSNSQERSGFDVDLYRWLANHVEPRFTPVEVDLTIEKREGALTEGRVSVVVEVFSITDERREQIGFAGPYLISQQGVMVRAEDDRIKVLHDLAGKTVCAQSGSTSLSQLDEGGLASQVTIVTEVSSRECVNRLLRKEVDAASTDQVVLHGFARSTPGLKVVEGLTFGSQERYGIGVPKGDKALCEQLTEGIRAFIVDGAWGSFFESNFKGLDPAGYKPDPYRLDPWAHGSRRAFTAG